MAIDNPKAINKLIAIEKAIDNAISITVLRNAKKYLKPLKKRVWYDDAVKYISIFEIVVAEILKKQQEEYIKIFENAEEVYIKQSITKAKKNYRTNEYLDERHNHVIVPDIVDTLITLENKFEKVLRDSYEKYISKGLVKDSAELVYAGQGMTFDFNEFDESSRDYLRDKKIKWAKQVKQGTEQKIKRILTEGLEKGSSPYDIADKIQKSSGFSYHRSEAIARTEVLSACNYTDYIANLNNPNAIGREWSSTRDERTRTTHSQANGQKRKKGEAFTIGGHKMLFPGDSSLGAPAKEVISCRCTTLSVFEGESMESNTVYDQEGVGTNEWLSQQSTDFQEDYLGGKIKQSLFQSGAIGTEDSNTPTAEVIKTLLENSVKNIKQIKGINPRNVLASTHYRNLVPAVLEVQEKGIKQNKEFARVVEYATGEPMGEGVLKDIILGTDKRTQVEITDKQWEEINKEDDKYILIHNHPDSISFSFGDIVAFHRNKGLKCMIVVGHDGSVYFLSGKGKLPNVPDNQDELEGYIKDRDSGIQEKMVKLYMLKYKGGTKNIAKKLKRAYNEVIRNELESMGYVYNAKEAL